MSAHDKRWSALMIVAMGVCFVLPRFLAVAQFIVCGLSLIRRVNK